VDKEVIVFFLTITVVLVTWHWSKFVK